MHSTPARGLASHSAVELPAGARPLRFWSIWLQCASASMAVFGVLLVLFHSAAVPGLTGALARSFWGAETLPADVVAYHRFLHAVLGATTTGWACTLAWVSRYAFAAGERWAWRCIAVGVAAWFALDSGSSALLGVWPNVWLNLLSVSPFVPPLAFTWRRFAARSPGR